MKAPPELIVYGDFNCPFSALASDRVARLEALDRARVEWRAVEHVPELPERGLPVEGELLRLLAEEVGHVHSLLRPGEHLALKVPERQGNTANLNQRYAAASLADRPQVRQQIFTTYWGTASEQFSAPPPTPHTIANYSANSITNLDLTAEATADLLLRWQAAWLATPRPIVPALVLPDGVVSRGLGALRRLADLLSVTAEEGMEELGGEPPCLAPLFDEPGSADR